MQKARIIIGNIQRKQAIWACVLSLGLSFSIVAGWLYETTSFLSFTPKYVLALITLFFVLTVPFYLLLKRTTCRVKKERERSGSPQGRIF